MATGPFRNSLTRRLGGEHKLRQLNDLALAAGIRQPGEPLTQIHVFWLKEMEDEKWQAALESHRSSGRMSLPLTFDGMQHVRGVISEIQIDERYIPRPAAERR